jgi:hypothetical protein
MAPPGPPAPAWVDLAPWTVRLSKALIERINVDTAAAQKPPGHLLEELAWQILHDWAQRSEDALSRGPQSQRHREQVSADWDRSQEATPVGPIAAEADEPVEVEGPPASPRDQSRPAVKASPSPTAESVPHPEGRRGPASPRSAASDRQRAHERRPRPLAPRRPPCPNTVDRKAGRRARGRPPSAPARRHLPTHTARPRATPLTLTLSRVRLTRHATLPPWPEALLVMASVRGGQVAAIAVWPEPCQWASHAVAIRAGLVWPVAASPSTGGARLAPPAGLHGLAV